MLSTSQARRFFLFATLGFSGIFLLLTADTLLRVGDRSHEDRMSESVVRGKHIWDRNNCMGCHTLLGEGAYYAPELTKVVDRRGKEWIRIFLRDPEAMYPGRRKMIQYDFTEDEITDVIAFLEWIGWVNTNGFPADPDLGPAAANAAEPAPAAAGPTTPRPPVPEIFSAVCVGCHEYDGLGGAVGPALDTVGQRYDAAGMEAWLRDPQSVKPGTTMPSLNLTDAQLAELTAFLAASK